MRGVQPGKGIESHPFFDELTPEWKRAIGRRPFDFVRLTKTSAERRVRYETHTGEGVYEALRKKNPKAHARLMREGHYAWLPRPKGDMEGTRSYFTEEGAREYEKRTRKTHRKRLGRLKKVEGGAGRVVHRDRLQAVVKQSEAGE